MVDIFIPDRSQFNGRTVSRATTGANAILARATEGDWLTDTEYAFNKQLAAKAGAVFSAYHFLEDGSSASSQAQYCHGVVGGTPLMVDLEPIVGTTSADSSRSGHYCGQAWTDLQAWQAAHGGHAGLLTANQASNASYVSKPTVAQACAFIDDYRAQGGISHVVYFPRWYWEVLGQPSLEPFIQRKVLLHSSNYTTYSDTGPGWQPYGGMTPSFWQYTNSGPDNEDWSCYMSTAASIAPAVEEIKNLWTRGVLTVAPTSGPTRREADGTESLAEVATSRNTTAAHLAAVSMEHTDAKNRWKFLQYLCGKGGAYSVMPAGLVYWTSH